MSAWDNLSIRDKAEMMRVAIGNGITNINDIKREYNEFAEGGNIYAMGTPLTEEQRRALARQYFWENKMDKAQQYAVPSIYEGGNLPEVAVTAERLPFEYQNVAPTDNTFVAGTGRTQNPQAMQRAIQGGEQLNAWHESHPVLSTIGTAAGAAPLAVASYPVASYPIAALGDAAYAARATPLIMEGMNVPFAASGLDNLAHGNADWQTALEIAPLAGYAKPMWNAGKAAYNTGKTALYNYRNPFGEAIVPRGFSELAPKEISMQYSAVQPYQRGKTSLALYERPQSRISAAERAGLSRYDRKPNSHNPIPITLVNRSNDFIPVENGNFVFGDPAQTKKLASVHFTQQAPVTSNSGGNWDSMSTTLLMPYGNMRKAAAPISIEPGDTFFPNYHGLKASTKGSKVYTGDKAIYDYYTKNGVEAIYDEDLAKMIDEWKSLDAQREAALAKNGYIPDEKVDQLDEVIRDLENKLYDKHLSFTEANRMPTTLEDMRKLDKIEGLKSNVKPIGRNDVSDSTQKKLGFRWFDSPPTHSNIIQEPQYILKYPEKYPKRVVDYARWIDENAADFRNPTSQITAENTAKVNWDADNWFKKISGRTAYSDEEAAELASHVPEYREIEKRLFDEGKLIENPDGIIVVKDSKMSPQEYIMRQSEAFQKMNPEHHYVGVRRSLTHRFENIPRNPSTGDGYEVWTDRKSPKNVEEYAIGGLDREMQIENLEKALLDRKEDYAKTSKELSRRLANNEISLEHYNESLKHLNDNYNRALENYNNKMTLLKSDPLNGGKIFDVTFPNGYDSYSVDVAGSHWANIPSDIVADAGIPRRYLRPGTVSTDGIIYAANEHKSSPVIVNIDNVMDTYNGTLLDETIIPRHIPVKSVLGNTGTFSLDDPNKWRLYRSLSTPLTIGAAGTLYNQKALGGRLYPDGGGMQNLYPNVGRAIQYFVERGLTDYQAAGLVGNLMRESSMSPTARNKWSGAYGLAQWLGDRRTNLFSKYGENPTFDQQLDYIWHELNSTHKNGLKNILASKTAEEAARNAMGYYEFSAGPEGAIRAMNKYGQDGEGSMRKGIEFANSLMGYYPNAGQAPVIQQPQQPDPYAYQQQILDSLNSLSNAFNTLAPAVLSYKSPVKTPQVQEIPEEPKFNPASLLTQYQMLDSVL